MNPLIYQDLDDLGLKSDFCLTQSNSSFDPIELSQLLTWIRKTANMDAIPHALIPPTLSTALSKQKLLLLNQQTNPPIVVSIYEISIII